MKNRRNTARSGQSALFWLLTTLLLLSPPAHAQAGEASTVRDVVGFETDVFPILSEGYHISVWYGFTHIRLRPFVAKDRVPQFAVQDGFKDNTVRSYALMADFFVDQASAGSGSEPACNTGTPRFRWTEPQAAQTTTIPF